MYIVCLQSCQPFSQSAFPTMCLDGEALLRRPSHFLGRRTQNAVIGKGHNLWGNSSQNSLECLLQYSTLSVGLQAEGGPEGGTVRSLILISILRVAPGSKHVTSWWCDCKLTECYWPSRLCCSVNIWCNKTESAWTIGPKTSICEESKDSCTMIRIRSSITDLIAHSVVWLMLSIVITSWGPCIISWMSCDLQTVDIVNQITDITTNVVIDNAAHPDLILVQELWA